MSTILLISSILILSGCLAAAIHHIKGLYDHVDELNAHLDELDEILDYYEPRMGNEEKMKLRLVKEEK